MVKTVFKVIGITLLLAYLLSAGILYGFWRQEPRFRDVMIDITYPSDEAHFISESHILSLIQGMPGFKYKGLTYPEVNTLELARYIEQHNRLVLHASCYHTTDSLLRIDVVQRNPIMRIMSTARVSDASGHSMQDFYVDLNGEMMPAVTGTAIRLPLVTGRVRSQDLQPLHDFALFLRDDDFWCDAITQVNLLDNGDVELIPRIGDHRILLGSLSNYRSKLRRVRTFYDEVLSRKGWNAYRVINVKFDGQVVGKQ